MFLGLDPKVPTIHSFVVRYLGCQVGDCPNQFDIREVGMCLRIPY